VYSVALRTSVAPAALAAALSLVTLLATDASAHGGLFVADELRIEPGNADHMLVRSDVWGMIETTDKGKTWRWTCAAAAYGDDLSVLREPLAMLPGGRLIIGSRERGIVRSKESLCDFEVVPFFSEPDCNPSRCVPYDMVQEAPDSSGVVVLTVAPQAGTFVSQLWRSPDAGDTWASMNAALPPEVFPISVTIAPSDTSVVYVGSSNATATPTLFLHRSVDGGRTFEQSTLPVTLGPDDPSVRLRFYGVHPKNPRAVFLWLDMDWGNTTKPAPDRLLVSFDGGVTITEAFVATNDMPGFAISKDGSTVYLGGTSDGLWSAQVADLEAGNADAFKRINSGNTWSLAFTDGGLYAGREEYSVEAGDLRMTLGLSKDDGVSFEPALVICDVAPAQCSTGTRSGDLTTNLYYGDGNFQYDQQLRRCADDPKPPVDAGTKPQPSPPKSEGCACRSVVPVENGCGTAAAALGVALALVRHRRGAREAPIRRTNRRTN
jgi:hypothetical protein